MLRKPLSVAKTIGRLAKLDRKADNFTLPKAIERVEQGDAYEEEARWLLDEFCKRAERVRKQFPYSDTPLLIEFVASRLILFLDGKEPDLMVAFGLKRPTRGPKPKSNTRRRNVFIAVKVLELMEDGKTLDQAAEIVAQEARIHESTARNYYVENKSEAKMILLHRQLLAPGALDTEDDGRSP